MALERERKFLIKKEIPLPIENTVTIRQGYFMANKEKQMRIRLTHPVLFSSDIDFSKLKRSDFIKDAKAILGYKKHINVTDREEHEWEIDVAMGEENAITGLMTAVLGLDVKRTYKPDSK